MNAPTHGTRATSYIVDDPNGTAGAADKPTVTRHHAPRRWSGYNAPGARTIHQSRRACARSSENRRRGPHQMPSVDTLFGSLVRRGLVKIIRKPGRAPRIRFLAGR